MSNPSRECIISPKTQRAIKIGGRTYINLIKTGKIKGTIAERKKYLLGSAAKRARAKRKKSAVVPVRVKQLVRKSSARANQPSQPNVYLGRRQASPGKRRLAPKRD